MKIIVDLTDVLLFFRAHWTVSGIQRVALRVTKLLIDKHGRDHDIKVMAMGRGGAVVLGDVSLFETDEFERESVVRALTTRWSRPVLRLEAISFLRSLGLKVGRRPPSPASRRFRGRPVTDADLRDATLLVLGGVRPIPEYWTIHQDLKRRGAREIVMMIYDLIPLIRAELVPDDQPAIFYESLHRAARAADRFLAISQTTADHLTAFLKAHDYPLKPIAVVPLAHEFVPRDEAPVPAPDIPPPRRLDVAETSGVQHVDAVDIRRQVKACRLHPYVLTVGTIEPRKNYLRLAQVWKDMLEECGPERTPHLVIAGKKSYARETFEEFIRVTGSLGGHIQIVDAPSDRELSYLYEHCLFSVFPSLAEGWGLPVGESLWQGKLCVASGTWSVPEVGGAFCDYFDPESPADMKEKLLRWIGDPAALQAREEKIRGTSWRTWSDVADDIWNGVQKRP